MHYIYIFVYIYIHMHVYTFTFVKNGRTQYIFPCYLFLLIYHECIFK